MSDALAIVTEFMEGMCGNKDEVAAAFHRWFTPTTEWENVGLATTRGPEEALQLMSGFEGSIGVVRMNFETLAIAAVGNKVLTERIDHMLDADGKTLGSIRLMGIFEVDGNGKISRWTDYFDAIGLNAQMEALTAA
jgi:limonene-1,2-epoxide hydrolase